MQLHLARLQRQRSSGTVDAKLPWRIPAMRPGISITVASRRPAGSATALAPLNSTCVSPARGPCGARAAPRSTRLTAPRAASHCTGPSNAINSRALELGRSQAAASRFHSVSGRSRLIHMPQPSGRKARRQLAPVPAAGPQPRDAVRAALIAIVAPVLARERAEIQRPAAQPGKIGDRAPRCRRRQVLQHVVADHQIEALAGAEGLDRALAASRSAGTDNR